jgi:hypothetical protein
LICSDRATSEETSSYERFFAGCERNLRAHQTNVNVRRWIDETDEAILFLTVLTLGEVRIAIERFDPESGAAGWSPGSWSICASCFREGF